VGGGVPRREGGRRGRQSEGKEVATSATPKPITDRESLIAAIGRGVTPKFLFFWGHRASASGRIGAECLSQWWPAPFVVDGVGYATAEHFMMAGKARLFGDDEARARILAAASPAAAKKLGRTVRGFHEQKWARARFDIVVAGSKAKFGQNPSLASFLVGTNERVLVEASPVDRIWGIGLAATNAAATDPERWRGLNLLGFALMEARRGIQP
jgi:ribA/ribD-fused uncharacterized protein